MRRACIAKERVAHTVSIHAPAQRTSRRQGGKTPCHSFDRASTVVSRPTASSQASEQPADQQQQPELYRMSPLSLPQIGHEGTPCAPTGDLRYSPSSSLSSSMGYPNTRQSSLSMPASDVYYHQPYGMCSPEPTESTCTCLTNPLAGAPLISLTHQLESTIELLRQLPEHATRHNCIILKHILRLHDVMHGGTGEDMSSTPFDGPSTPDGELVSPVSPGDSGMYHKSDPNSN